MKKYCLLTLFISLNWCCCLAAKPGKELSIVHKAHMVKSILSDIIQVGIVPAADFPLRKGTISYNIYCPEFACKNDSLVRDWAVAVLRLVKVYVVGKDSCNLYDAEVSITDYDQKHLTRKFSSRDIDLRLDSLFQVLQGDLMARFDLLVGAFPYFLGGVSLAQERTFYFHVDFNLFYKWQLAKNDFTTSLSLLTYDLVLQRKTRVYKKFQFVYVHFPGWEVSVIPTNAKRFKQLNKYGY